MFQIFLLLTGRILNLDVHSYSPSHWSSKASSISENDLSDALIQSCRGATSMKTYAYYHWLQMTSGTKTVTTNGVVLKIEPHYAPVCYIRMSLWKSPRHKNKSFNHWPETQCIGLYRMSINDLYEFNLLLFRAPLRYNNWSIRRLEISAQKVSIRRLVCSRLRILAARYRIMTSGPEKAFCVEAFHETKFVLVWQYSGNFSIIMGGICQVNHRLLVGTSFLREMVVSVKTTFCEWKTRWKRGQSFWQVVRKRLHLCAYKLQIMQQLEPTKRIVWLLFGVLRKSGWWWQDYERLGLQ